MQQGWRVQTSGWIYFTKGSEVGAWTSINLTKVLMQRKVISEVYVFFVLKCTVFGRKGKHKTDVKAGHGIHFHKKKSMKYPYLSILVYQFRPERTGFNMYAEYTRPQLTFLALVPWTNLIEIHKFQEKIEEVVCDIEYFRNYVHFFQKKLSLCHKLKFSFPYLLATWWC